MRLLGGMTVVALLFAQAAQAATVASASVRTWLSVNVVNGNPNDLALDILPFALLDQIDIDGPVSIDISEAEADEAGPDTTVDLAVSTGTGGGLIDLVGFGDLSLILWNMGNDPIEVSFSMTYELDAAVSISRPFSDTAFAFASIDVSSSLASIAFFIQTDTALSALPPTVAGLFSPASFRLAGGEFVDIEVLTEAQVLIDATPIPLPPAGLLLIGSIGALAAVRSGRRQATAGPR